MEDRVPGTHPTAISVSPALTADNSPNSGAMIAATKSLASRCIVACATVTSAFFAYASR